MKNLFKSFVAGVFVLALFTSQTAVAQVEQKDVGVVLIHGKWGNPNGNIKSLAEALKSNGYQVITPLMPWSRKRGYDKPYTEAISELDEIVNSLRSKGLSRVYVMGTSFGANGSLAYAAYGKYPIDGVIAIAPGHIVDESNSYKLYGQSLSVSGDMIKNGKGDEIATFRDVNGGKQEDFPMKASTYWSYFDPKGMGSMSLSSKKVTQKIPLVVLLGGSHDISAKLGKGYIFSNWPEHPQSVYTTIDGAEHFTAPEFAIDTVLKWLAAQKK
jgi:dienelactone hydrolase